MIGALPDIGARLGNVGSLSWVLTVYLLASAVSVLASGQLIDSWGPRSTFRASVLVFLAASIACALSPSLWVLLIARTVQGLGGGMVNAVAIASTGIGYPERLRARAFAAQSVVWSITGVGGPPLVALLVSGIGWRGVFWLNVPLTLAMLWFGWRELPSTAGSGRANLDRAGVLLICVLTVTAMLGLARLDVWSAPFLAVALMSAALYARHARRAAEPLLDLAHMARRPLGSLNATMTLTMGTTLGIESFLPVYTRAALGYSKAAAAFTVVFVTFGWTAGAVISARLVKRLGEARLILVGTVALPFAFGAAAFAIHRSASLILVGAIFVVAGLAVGIVLTVGLTLLQNVSDANALGRVNGASQYLRTVGVSAGIAVTSGVVMAVVAGRIGDVEAVRRLLAGNEVSLDAQVVTALRDGYFTAQLVAVALTALAIEPARRLRRATRP